MSKKIKLGDAEVTEKAMRTQLKELLAMPVMNTAAKNRLRKLGIKSEDMTNQMLLLIVLFQQGLQGDLEAIKMMDEMTGGGFKDSGRDITINLQVTPPTRHEEIAAPSPQVLPAPAPATEEVEVLE